MEKIEKTAIWKKLMANPQFEERYNNILKRARESVNNESDINIEASLDKLTVQYTEPIKNRELDCQYQTYKYFEFYFDSDDNMIVNKASGTIRSQYGYGFNRSNGGVITTEYSCNVFDADGIELAKQHYADEYELNREEFDIQKDGISGAVHGVYNPHLEETANLTGIYNKPTVIGVNAQFFRQIRSKNDLGIVNKQSCQFDSKIGGAINQKEELFFNTFVCKQNTYTPELIHTIYGHPFGVFDKSDGHLDIDQSFEEYGVTTNNYKEVAKVRFLKELQAIKAQHLDQKTASKYDMLISKIEAETMDKGTTR